MFEVLIQEMKEDNLNIWMTYLENYETKIRPISLAELEDIYDLKGDIFFNMDKFEKADI